MNFVVAQVRFPLVASISDQAFIGTFQERIRATYSDLRREEERQVIVGPTGAHAEQPNVVWRFTDDESGWAVALAPEFLALATNRYTNRSDFLGRLGILLEALDSWIKPRKALRLGVRYIDRIGQEHLSSINQLVKPEVLGPVAIRSAQEATLQHCLTDCLYEFADKTSLRARWGFLPAKTTFDPAVEAIDSDSWILDLDASHDERPFELQAIQDCVQLFSDRIYRYFRWTTTNDFLTTFGGNP